MEFSKAASAHRRRIFDQASRQIEAQISQVTFTEFDAGFSRRFARFQIDDRGQRVGVGSGLVIERSVFFARGRPRIPANLRRIQMQHLRHSASPQQPENSRRGKRLQR